MGLNYFEKTWWNFVLIDVHKLILNDMKGNLNHGFFINLMCCFDYVLLLNFCYLSIMDKISKWCPFDIRVITSMKLFKTYGMCCNLHTYHFECILPLLLDYIMRGIMRIVFLLLCLIVFLDFCVGLILCQSSLFHNTCFSQENQPKHIIFPPYRQTMYYTSHTPILASIILN